VSEHDDLNGEFAVLSTEESEQLKNPDDAR
jgi:hypothetical protein